jgi:hypothetical protein
MSSAIDVFREQREAADQLQARLTEISELLHQVQQQVNAVATNNEFRTVLRDEHNWLQQAQLVASQVRAFREEDVLRFWPGVVRRWIVALLFALGSAAAAGASYAWAMKPHAAELEELRSRLAFVEVVEHRFVTMTPAERRQFDALMKWNRSKR